MSTKTFIKDLVKGIAELRKAGYENTEHKGVTCTTYEIKLEEDLLMIFVHNNFGSPVFYLEKRLSKTLTIAYFSHSTTITDSGLSLFKVVVNQNCIEFDIFPCQQDSLKYFDGLKSVCPLIGETVRYSGEYGNIHLLQVELQRYTSNEAILKYFSKNHFISSPEETV